MTTPIYYIKNGALSFADKLIFEELELYLYSGDKVCFVGKNGSGKSSLFKVITGEYSLDSGDLYKEPNILISYLKQDSELRLGKTIYDYVLEGLNLEEQKYNAAHIIENLELDPDKQLNQLSGGQLRRATLAKTLTISPDILLLDEPTNHLDIKSIEWLEGFIKSYQGSVVCISHDRRFLSNVTNKIWWLDRGLLRKSNQGFSNFETWQAGVIEMEENTLRKLDRKLAEENLWLSQGVTARRKRNQKRLASLKTLRLQQQEFKSHINNAKARLEIDLAGSDAKSKFVIEAENLTHSFGAKIIVENFNIRVKKGEKIGIIGPNGSGKSTFIKLLLGLLKPDSGKVRFGTNIDITYVDQDRNELNPEDSLIKTLCPTGGDTVFLKDREMHVAGYLKQFLFHPKIIHSKVSTLSGGERNRLLLAKSLIKPGNFMVLDEPTNDLDMETLDLLIEILSDYEGTLLVISHDRDFLDKLVTKTLIFTDDGKIIESVFGYDEFSLRKSSPGGVKLPDLRSSRTKRYAVGLDGRSPGHHLDLLGENNFAQVITIEKPKQNKISFKYLHLQKTLPGEIEKLEKEISGLELQLSDQDLYTKDPNKFNQITSSLKKKSDMLEEKIQLWIEVEEICSNN